MFLSILICIHSNDNIHDKLLIDSLNSLEHQTYKNFDVYIVFDQCWENTSKFTNKYSFKIHYLYKNNKEGLAIAKNFGLKYINSEWVGFLDSDDIYLPLKLEKQINFLNNNTNIDFLGTLALNRYINSFNYFDSCIKSGLYTTHEEIKNRIFTENILTHGSMLIKRDCLIKLNGYRNIKGCEDWDLWKRAIDMNYVFHQLQERLYVYTIGTSVLR